MGFYVERSDRASFGKAEGIASEHGGSTTRDPAEARAALDAGKGVLVVISNATFEAAGFVPDADEWVRFHPPGDGRTREYVIMDRKIAEDLSGYAEWLARLRRRS